MLNWNSKAESAGLKQKPTGQAESRQGKLDSNWKPTGQTELKLKADTENWTQTESGLKLKADRANREPGRSIGRKAWKFTFFSRGLEKGASKNSKKIFSFLKNLATDNDFLTMTTFLIFFPIADYFHLRSETRLLIVFDKISYSKCDLILQPTGAQLLLQAVFIPGDIWERKFS